MPDATLTEMLYADGAEGEIDPFAVFEEWLALARESEINDPHAMSLASVDDQGMPDVRMVLLNAHDSRGFAFFTNFESDKGRQLLANPRAALCLHWKSLRRQVRVRGSVEIVSDAEADDYFSRRPRGSQLGAHASRQSRPLENRGVLIGRVEALDGELGSQPVIRPSHWSGFRVLPLSIEFWKDGAFRLHDRVRFVRNTPGAEWNRQRLYP